MASPDSSALLELAETHETCGPTHYVFDNTAYWEELWTVPATGPEISTAIVPSATDLGFGGEHAERVTAPTAVLRTTLVLMAIAGRAWRRTSPEKSHVDACTEFKRRAEHWRLENPFNNFALVEDDDEAYVPLPHTRDVFEGTTSSRHSSPTLRRAATGTKTRRWDTPCPVGLEGRHDCRPR